MMAKRLLVALSAIFLLAGFTSETVEFQTVKLYRSDKDTTLVSAQIFKPEGSGPFPAVVLLHTCGGLQPHVTEDWPKFLTGIGYVVVTVDSYGSRGFSDCTEIDSLNEGLGYQARDAFAALDYLAVQSDVDGGRVGVMGFSTGANAINYSMTAFVNVIGRERNFKAAIAVYGRCTDPFRKKTHLLEITPEKDPWADSCQYIEKHPLFEVHVIPGAFHGFDHSHMQGRQYDPAGTAMEYSWSAVKEARSVTKAFLDKHLQDPKLIEEMRQRLAKMRKANLNGIWDGIRECDGVGSRKFSAVVRNGKFAVDLGGSIKEQFAGVISPRGKVSITGSYVDEGVKEKIVYFGQLPLKSGSRKAILKGAEGSGGCQVTLTSR